MIGAAEKRMAAMMDDVKSMTDRVVENAFFATQKLTELKQVVI